MANMFPVRSGLGNARIDDSGNEIDEIIARGKELALFNRDILNNPNNQPRIPTRGIDTIAAMGRPKQPGTTLEEPLKFGGVTNPQAMAENPIRQVRSDIYDKQSKPQEQPETGMSNDNKLFWPRQNDNDIDSVLNRRVKEQQIEKSQADIDSKGWKTVQVADPNDPTKQIWVRHNSISGETKPLELGEKTTVQTAAQGKINAADAEKATEKANRRKAIVENTNATLSLLDDLLDKNDQLTPEAARAVGKSAVGNWIPTSMGYSGSAKIDRLAGRQVLDLIEEMKSQSRTGATGFGQMNRDELRLLVNSASLLNNKFLDEETYRGALKDVRDRLKKVLMDGPNESSSVNNAPNASTDNVVAQGKIRVKNKATGQTGTISEGAFNPVKYERIQ